MKQFIFFLLHLCFMFAFSENCDKYGIRLYEDMACTPENNGGPCPTSFNCKLTSAANECMVRGKVYNSGEAIPKDKSGHTCEFGCSCNRPEIGCPQWGCGDWADVPPVPTDCYREYELDECCSTGIRCPPFNDTTTCVIDGTEYKAGQKFFPKDSCYACLCQKGFNGKFEAPFCKRRGCDAQVKHQEQIQKSCAGVYLKTHNEGEARCCPSQWTCHDGTEIIKSDGNKSNSATCKYGDKILQIGDRFEKEVKVTLVTKTKVKCECKIPPLVMCLEA
ncbi:uncharacterized protein LOC135132598 [Zophobas morio]|uniref:uncharacterized protein LOC135132598 n=1 Tax=Zophobas morio TaxID=2755281 RepID=UPI0030827AC0